MGDLGLLQIGKNIRGALDDMRDLDARLRTLENRLDVGTDPTISTAGFSNVLSPRSMFPVKVSEIDTVNGVFKATVLTVTNVAGAGAFTTDLFVTADITVAIPPYTLMPEVDDVVGALFYGSDVSSDGVFTAKYALVDNYVPMRIAICGTGPMPGSDPLDPSWYYVPGLRVLRFSRCFSVTDLGSGKLHVDYKDAGFSGDLGFIYGSGWDVGAGITPSFYTAISGPQSVLYYHYVVYRFKCGFPIGVVSATATTAELPCCATGGEQAGAAEQAVFSGSYQVLSAPEDFSARLWDVE